MVRRNSGNHWRFARFSTRASRRSGRGRIRSDQLKSIIEIVVLRLAHAELNRARNSAPELIEASGRKNILPSGNVAPDQIKRARGGRPNEQVGRGRWITVIVINALEASAAAVTAVRLQIDVGRKNEIRA